MDTWLEWACGPMFWGAFSFMVLGLLRHVFITVWEVQRALSKAGDKSMPYKAIVSATLKWLFPIGKIQQRWFFSLSTMAFHISVIIVPIFLAGHVVLWERGLGLAWPVVPNSVADVLTVVAVVTAILLVIERASAKDARVLSRFQDYALPIIIIFPFVSGFLVMHPVMNPFSYEATLLFHVISANLVLILIPITKIAHCVLLPSTQLVSEIGWHFTPDAGSKVAVALGKENQPI